MKIGIITAASEKYANSLFVLIGSLNCNWPNHPKIIVYNIGLSENTKSKLAMAGIEVLEVPPFCDHWRSHYTWKLWCLSSAEFDLILWMDSGICILQPLDEVIEIIKCKQYFLVPNYQFLDYEVSENTCKACDVPNSFRFGKATIAGSMIGYLKQSKYGLLIDKAFEIALIEANIKAFNSRHKHDQSIISILTYKYFPNPELNDGIKYLGWESPRMVQDQKVWLQRRQILPKDLKHFMSYLDKTGERYTVGCPHKDVSFLRRVYKIILNRSKSFFKAQFYKPKFDGIR
jgi:hypothetical protein